MVHRDPAVFAPTGGAGPRRSFRNSVRRRSGFGHPPPGRRCDPPGAVHDDLRLNADHRPEPLQRLERDGLPRHQPRFVRTGSAGYCDLARGAPLGRPPAVVRLGGLSRRHRPGAEHPVLLRPVRLGGMGAASQQPAVGSTRREGSPWARAPWAPQQPSNLVP